MDKNFVWQQMEWKNFSNEVQHAHRQSVADGSLNKCLKSFKIKIYQVI